MGGGAATKRAVYTAPRLFAAASAVAAETCTRSEVIALMVGTPSREELLAAVIEIVVRLAHERGVEIDAGALGENTNVCDYDLDSMDQVLILNEVEDRWNVTVDDDAARGGESIGALVDAVAAALANR